MIKINMAVTVDTAEELLEALKSAGPNVASFYGEVRGLERSDAAQAISNAAQKPDKPAVEPGNSPTEPEPVYSMTEVRAGLAKVRELQGSDGMRAILRAFGSEKLAYIDPAKYPGIMQDIEKVLKEANQNAC